MHAYVYPARIEHDPEGIWLVRFRDLPDAITQASLGEDPVDLAEGCIQAAIEGRLLHHEPIPVPSAPRPGEVMIAVPLETASKAAMLRCAAESGLSQSGLARAVGLDEKEIRRMLDPTHATKLPRIAKVLRALGKELQLTVTDAARMPKGSRRNVAVASTEARERKVRYKARPKAAAKNTGARQGRRKSGAT